MSNTEYTTIWTSVTKDLYLTSFVFYCLISFVINIALCIYYPTINLMFSFVCMVISIILSEYRGHIQKSIDPMQDHYSFIEVLTASISFSFFISGQMLLLMNMFMGLFYSDFGRLCRYRGYVLNTKKNRLKHTLRILNGELSRDIPKNFK